MFPSRDCVNLAEITHTLLQSINNGDHVTLWQNLGNLKRIHHVQLKNIDLSERLIMCQTADDRHFEFDTDTPVFFKASTKEILFRNKIHLQSKKTLFLPIPQEVILLESRKDPRVEFSKDDNETIKFQLLQATDVPKQIFENPLTNLSKNGACFYEKAPLANKMFVGSRLFLKTIRGRTFSESIPAVIKHVTPIKGKKTKRVIRYKIGIRFEESLTGDYLT